ncbi:MAG: restriction endonuclease subunit S [Spirochaetota bacterium]
MTIYKRFGDYIELVDERNCDLEDLPLMGLSISKEFIPSVANIIGTDLSNYKVIKKQQFACSLMQVSRDGKMPIAMYKDEAAIMSPAYPMFEVKDKRILIPEYLMMWFSRSEFDRQAAYYAVGGVRGNLPWEDFCDMKFPVPSIEKQREIVAEYNAVQNRIDLNNKMIQKLEETAQAIYREWFVGSAYVENEKIKLNQLVQTQYGYTETASMEIIGPKFLRITDIAQNQIDWSSVPYCKISKSNFEKYRLKSGDIVVARTGATVGFGKRLHKHFPDCVFASFLVRFIPIELKWSLFLGLTVDCQNYRDFILSNAEGSAQPQANATLLTSYEIDKPEETKLLEFNKIIEPIFDLVENKQIENQKLEKLKELLLSRLAKG